MEAPAAGAVYQWVGLPNQTPDNPIVRIDSLSASCTLEAAVLDDFCVEVRTVSIPLADFVAAVELGCLIPQRMVAVKDLMARDQIRLGRPYLRDGVGWAIEVVYSIEAKPDLNCLRVYFDDSAPIDFQPDDQVILHRRPSYEDRISYGDGV